MDNTTETLFYNSLLRFSQQSEVAVRRKIEQQLWDDYGVSISVLVVDMSGFTRLTEAYGIVNYLSMVRRMQLITMPIIESYNGIIIKFEADNVFARFNAPGDAIQAAIALNLALESANFITPDIQDISIACGIDHGDCLIPHPSDCFGSAVNYASKLGEDLAKPGQILVTDAALSLAPTLLDIQTKQVDVTIGGKDIIAHEIIYRLVGTSKPLIQKVKNS